MIYKATLRLGILEIKSGNIDAGANTFQKALSLEPTSIVARILLASTLPSKPRRKLLEQILIDGNTRDMYTLCSIGNIHYQTAMIEKNPSLKSEYISKALEFYDKTLRLNGRCFIGAVGMGCCFAELKR